MRLCGYAWLQERFALPAFPLAHRSRLGTVRAREVDAQGVTTETFPFRYDPGEEPFDQLVFALKYEGVELAVLASLFPRLERAALAEWIDQSPTSKYTRRIGFLYEFLTQTALPLADRTQGNYVDVLDAAHFIVSPRALPNERWRVRNNLLGSATFCPTVRRREGVQAATVLEIKPRLEGLRTHYTTGLFLRAVQYAYLKETRSSYQIEHEEPPQPRVERFIELLKKAGHSLELTEPALTQLQNAIVEQRYQEGGYRLVQNYVGEARGIGREKVHYICPPAHLAPLLMEGLASCTTRLPEAAPVVAATVLAFSFVLIHPFEDGNGRLHRFLIHDTLVRTGFLPEGFLLPVSAVMLRKRDEYDRVLERFSRPVMRLAEYTLSEYGELTLHNGAVLEPLYRYPDLTAAVEYLASVIVESVEKELAEELRFLQQYDQARDGVCAIVDLPDRRCDLLLRLLQQNRGTLSKAKRALFPELTDRELAAMEAAFQRAFSEGSN